MEIRISLLNNNRFYLPLDKKRNVLSILKLLGDFTGGLILFGIATIIATIELYMIRGLQAHSSSGVGGLGIAVPGGGGSTAGGTRSGGGKTCKGMLGWFRCPEEAVRN